MTPLRLQNSIGTQWAVFALDPFGERQYRYELGIRLKPTGNSRIAWIMLNPSLADHTRLDPTIRRCVKFSQRWGYDELVVGNLYGFITPYPGVMEAAEDPVGPENDWWLTEMCLGASEIVCAWGASAFARARGESVATALGRTLMCLGTNTDGSPRHPLYVDGETELRTWRTGKEQDHG